MPAIVVRRRGLVDRRGLQTALFVGLVVTSGLACVGKISGQTDGAGGAAATPGGDQAGGSGPAVGAGGGIAASGAGGDAVIGGAGGTAATGGAPQSGLGGTSATGGAASTGTGGSLITGAGGAVATGAGGAADADPCGRPKAIAIPVGYQTLVWHDEFDTGDAPDASNWGFETGFLRNQELQWYQAANAQIAGGMLVITGKRQTVTNPNYQAGSADWKASRPTAGYTSSSLTTAGKQSWEYGRFEMCAKIPISAGMWPAWWTLGTSGVWPSNGEIDIMEYYAGKILANVACGTATAYQPKWISKTMPVDDVWAAAFHLWRMDWDGTTISLYVDDTPMSSVKLSDVLNADGSSPFMQKAYMILNLAIGGLNGGDPSATTFPQTYQIDYVRVFQ